MNKFKYFANLYYYTLTKNNFNEGEDTSTAQRFACDVYRIEFTTVSELKYGIAQRILHDFSYSHNLCITHLDSNKYGVNWLSRWEDDNGHVDEETMEKFKRGEVDIYAGQMTIYIYKVKPLNGPNGLDFDFEPLDKPNGLDFD